MRLLEAIPAARLATSASGLYRGIGLAILRNRIGTALDRLALAIPAIASVSTISAVAPIIGAVAIAEAVLVAPEGTIAVGVVARMAVLLMLLALMRLSLMLGHRRL